MKLILVLLSLRQKQGFEVETADTDCNWGFGAQAASEAKDAD